jgi:acyl-CoA thioester hydrolase
MNTPTKTRKDNILTRRTAYSNWASEQVRFSDTDMLGHVNNASLATYYETGRAECILKVLTTDAAPSIVYVVAKLTINFIGEVHWPAKIDIGTGILSIGRTSFIVGQALFDGDKCMGIAESVMVAIDINSRVPCAIPEWERQQLARISIAAAE